MADKINHYVKQKNTQHATSFFISIMVHSFLLRRVQYPLLSGY